jgi:hypothetical protein
MMGVPRKIAKHSTVRMMKGERKINPSKTAIKSKMRLLTGYPEGKSIEGFYQTLWYILQQEQP